MPLTRRLLQWGGALLAVMLTLGGPAVSSATPQTPAPVAGVAASDGGPTSLALAMPITVPAGATGLIPADLLARYTAPEGTLTQQLQGALNRPIALGIDPMIVASIRILGTSAPKSAAQWLATLEGAGNETFALAYADADVAALSQAGLSPITIPLDFVTDPALFPTETDDTEPSPPSASPSASPEPSTPPSPEPTVPSGAELIDLPNSLDATVWPRDDTIVGADLAVFSATEPATTIIDSGSVSYPRDAIPASAKAGGHAVLVSNNDVSTLLRDAVSATSDAAWQASMTQLRSALAGWTGGPSTVLATLAREPLAPPTRVAETLAALATEPTVAMTGLRQAGAEPPVEVAVVDSPVPVERVAGVQRMLATEALTTQFATVLADPSLITGEQRRRLLALASNSWVHSSGDWASAVDRYIAAVGELVNSVQVLESSTINLLSDSGDLPITVSNALPYPVTVSVQLLANTAILDVRDNAVEVTIEPESQARASVPVESIANGTAVLSASLLSPTGLPIGTPVSLTTKVEAGWETAFTAIVAGIVLLVFIVGVVRTVTRRRRERQEREAS